MKNGVLKSILALAFLSLNGCSGIKESLGLTRSVPDEFEVTRHHALEIPSDMNAPEPGSSLQVLDRIDIETILVPHDRNVRLSVTRGEKGFLKTLDVNPYPGVRDLVNQELNVLPTSAKKLQEKARSIIMFWKSADKKKPAKIISAQDEQKRLEKNGLSA
jgi:hypothetical protein